MFDERVTISLPSSKVRTYYRVRYCSRSAPAPVRREMVVMTTHTEPRDTSAVGKNPHKRNAIGTAMRVLTTVTGSDFAEKYQIREPINRIAYQATKTGFQTLGAANRAFKKVQGGSGGAARLSTTPKDYFNLNPDDEQQMIAETVKEFAEEILRPAAYDADAAASAPDDIVLSLIHI